MIEIISDNMYFDKFMSNILLKFKTCLNNEINLMEKGFWI